jgi:hypothetical protein
MKLTIMLLLASVIIAGAQPVPDFTLTNVADGKQVTLSEFKTCAGLVVVFTSNECAYDNYYRDRIRSAVAEYKGQIQFLLVNSLVGTKESEQQMITNYNTWNIPVPYLVDKDQATMQSLGARKSPEVFLLKNNSGKFNMFYKGAIDDNPQVASDVGQAYLKDAVKKLLANQKADRPSTRAVGCMIRKK